MLTTRLNLAPKLRMSEVVHMLLLYGFIHLATMTFPNERLVCCSLLSVTAVSTVAVAHEGPIIMVNAILNLTIKVWYMNAHIIP